MGYLKRQNAMNQDNNNPLDAPLDFSKFLESTLKHEEMKKSTILPGSSNEREKSPNQEYRERYSNSAIDRFWIGPRRY
jgi:hypothetical protein